MLHCRIASLFHEQMSSSILSPSMPSGSPKKYHSRMQYLWHRFDLFWNFNHCIRTADINFIKTWNNKSSRSCNIFFLQLLNLIKLSPSSSVSIQPYSSLVEKDYVSFASNNVVIVIAAIVVAMTLNAVAEHLVIGIRSHQRKQIHFFTVALLCWSTGTECCEQQVKMDDSFSFLFIIPFPPIEININSI